MFEPEDFGTAVGIIGGLLLLLALGFSNQPGNQDPGFVGCYDGDTCTFDGLDRRVRLARIDAPERNGGCWRAALDARDALELRLEAAGVVRVESVGVGRYGRLVAEVYADSVNLSGWLMRHGYAVKYGEEPCPRPEDDYVPHLHRKQDAVP